MGGQTSPLIFKIQIRFVALNGILVWLTLLGLISGEGSGDDGPEDLFEDDGKDIDMTFPEGTLLKPYNFNKNQ